MDGNYIGRRYTYLIKGEQVLAAIIMKRDLG